MRFLCQSPSRSLCGDRHRCNTYFLVEGNGGPQPCDSQMQSTATDIRALRLTDSLKHTPPKLMGGSGTAVPSGSHLGQRSILCAAAPEWTARAAAKRTNNPHGIPSLCNMALQMNLLHDKMTKSCTCFSNNSSSRTAGLGNGCIGCCRSTLSTSIKAVPARNSRGRIIVIVHWCLQRCFQNNADVDELTILRKPCAQHLNHGQSFGGQACELCADVHGHRDTEPSTNVT